MDRKTSEFILIETLRWEPEGGFLRLDQHLRRLTRSADALGFRQPQDARRKLEEQATGDSPLRVRLTMDYRGRCDVATTPFQPLPDTTVWRLRIAETRLDSSDTIYRHKTSRREAYEAARAEFAPEDADEVLLLNENGDLCEGSITSLFVEDEDGMLLTPPLDCGILPGILRADLIRERRARSHRLKVEDIGDRPVYVGNSLRGLIRAELV